MTNLVNIKKVAEIRTGYTFRRSDAIGREDSLLGLQIGDIRDIEEVDPQRLSAVEWQGKGQPPVLTDGDVVLAAKGNHNRAVLFRRQVAKVLPSNQFLILSVKRDHQVSPEFLCWVLNYPATQQRIAEFRSGTGIPSISKRSLEAIQIPLPERNVQEKILAFQKIVDQQQRTFEALQKNTETMLLGMAQELLNGAAK